jgi:CheY-like chemotaxis protein
MVFDGDAGMIQQVIVNLCVNARDAMPNGGTLTVTTGRVVLDVGAIPESSGAAAGAFVTLDVRDTGTGMSEETLSHIFEPFFTTKEVGKGTGLGLATAHGLVAQHRGWLEVQSTPGSGTTFRVFLPALDREPTAERPAAIIQTAAARATVLLVEDEPAVRAVVARALRRLGYQLLEASNGVEALDVWKRAEGQVDLLLTDMVMPEQLSGLDLAIRLRAEAPLLKVVIMSGYDERLLGQDAALTHDVEFIGKPFSIASLGDVVTRMLGTVASAPGG